MNKKTPTKEVIEARMTLIINALRNDNTQRKDFVSGMVYGMGYNTMVEFLEDCTKVYGMCYEVMEIGAMYYMSEFNKNTLANIYNQSKDWFKKEVSQ